MPDDRTIKGGIVGSRNKPKREERDTLADDVFLASLGTSTPESVIEEKKEEVWSEVAVNRETGEVLLPSVEREDATPIRRRRRGDVKFHERYVLFSSYIDKRLLPAFDALNGYDEDTKTDIFDEAISLLLVKYKRMIRDEAHIDVESLPLYPLPRKKRY